MARAQSVKNIATEPATPEADRLEQFPHPRETRDVFGHDSAALELAQDYRTNTMHHAQLVTGPLGIGKATLAYRFAKFALSGRPSGEGLALPNDVLSKAGVRQVEQGLHPNLLIINREWQQKTKRLSTVISVDGVRKLRSFLAHTTQPDLPRIVIVDQADELNLAAANALLKSLEEPPSNTIFFIISSQPDRLLPTIKSRCRRLALFPLNASDLIAAVAEAARGMDFEGPDDPDLLTILASGSPRRALALQSGEGIANYKKIVRLLSTLPGLDLEAAHTLSDTLAPASAEQNYEMALSLLDGTLARMIRHAATGVALPPAESKISDALMRKAPAKWAEAWHVFGAERRRVADLNLDRKTFVLETFLQLDALARQTQR